MRYLSRSDTPCAVSSLEASIFDATCSTYSENNLELATRTGETQKDSPQVVREGWKALLALNRLQCCHRNVHLRPLVGLRSCLVHSDCGADLTSRDRAIHRWRVPTVMDDVASQFDADGTNLAPRDVEESADLLTLDMEDKRVTDTDKSRRDQDISPISASTSGSSFA